MAGDKRPGRRRKLPEEGSAEPLVPNGPSAGRAAHAPSKESTKRRARHEIWELEEQVQKLEQAFGGLEKENEKLKMKLAFMQKVVAVKEDQVERIKQFGVHEDAYDSDLLHRSLRKGYQNDQGNIWRQPAAPAPTASRPAPGLQGGPVTAPAGTQNAWGSLEAAADLNRLGSLDALDHNLWGSPTGAAAGNNFWGSQEEAGQNLWGVLDTPGLDMQGGQDGNGLGSGFLQPQTSGSTQSRVGSDLGAQATSQLPFHPTASTTSPTNPLDISRPAPGQHELGASESHLSLSRQVSQWSEVQLIETYKQTSTQLSQLLLVAEDSSSPGAPAALAQLYAIVGTIQHLGAIAKVCNPAIVRVVSRPVSAGIDLAADEHWESVATSLLLSQQQIDDLVLLNHLRLKWLRRIQQDHVVLSSTLTEVLKEVELQWKVAWNEGQVRKAEMMNKLHRVIGAERWVLVLVDELLTAHVLDRLQFARCLVHSYPYVPDACAIVDAVDRLQRSRMAGVGGVAGTIGA